MKFLLSFFALLALSTARADDVPGALQPIDDAPGLPRVLIIGDSVSMGYTEPVRDRLRGKANVHRIPENGQWTRHGLARLAAWLGSGKWDVITFNFGLHDAKLPPEGKGHAPVEEYEKNLREIVNRLRTTGAKLVWCTTTPIPDGGELTPTRRFGDITKYNAAAERVMQENGVVVVDLYGAILPKVDTLQIAHDVHFKKDGSAFLGERVAAAVATLLPKR